ncbi:DNA repair protein rad2 [Zalaria obscura]|uniref:DNA repair protein rad2 n=1 Tax=Zalaria obscura TaxID=2024903 RepID=A0ACC3S4D5_9PEZI
MEKLQEESAGGFERTDTGPQKKKAAEPLPPWFAGNIEEDIAAQKKIETEDRQRAKEFDKSFQFTEGPVLGRSRAPEVIDLDAPKPSGTSQEVIDLDSDDDRGARASVTPTAAEEDATTKMGDVADAVRAVPPSPPAAEATDRVEPVMERHVTEVAADDGTVDQEKANAGNPFRKKFRRNATKLFLPPSFPDPRVDMAYLEPEVDSDPSPFQWGVPDLSALRSFLMATIGWSQERTDEVLVPVIKDMNRRVDEGTQSNITAFFQGGTGAGAYAPRQRVEQGTVKPQQHVIDRTQARVILQTVRAAAKGHHAVPARATNAIRGTF